MPHRVSGRGAERRPGPHLLRMLQATWRRRPRPGAPSCRSARRIAGSRVPRRSRRARGPPRAHGFPGGRRLHLVRRAELVGERHPRLQLLRAGRRRPARRGLQQRPGRAARPGPRRPGPRRGDTLDPARLARSSASSSSRAPRPPSTWEPRPGSARRSSRRPPPFVAWSQGGMETTLHGPADAPLRRRDRRTSRPRAASPAAAADRRGGTTWVRVEGFAWVVGIVLAAAVASLATGGAPRGARARLAAALAMAAAALALQLVLRRAIFGEWLPEHRRREDGVDRGVLAARGLRYVASRALVGITPLFGALALVPALKHERLVARRTALAGAGVTAGFVVYCLVVGGDWMPFFRFLAPVAPMLALVIAIGADRLAMPLGPLILACAATIQPLALFDVHIAPEAACEALRFRSFKGGVPDRGRQGRDRQGQPRIPRSPRPRARGGDGARRSPRLRGHRCARLVRAGARHPRPQRAGHPRGRAGARQRRWNSGP